MRFALPLVLAMGTFAVHGDIVASMSHQVEVLLLLPYILLSLVMMLCQPFNQSKTGISAMLMLLAYYLIQQNLQAPLAQSKTGLTYILLSILLPLNLFQLHFIPERRLFSRFGLIYLGILGLQLSWGWLLIKHVEPDQTTNVWQTYFYTLGDFSPLPLILILMLLALTCASASIILKRNQGYDQATFICLLFSGLTLAQFQQPYMSSIAFTVASGLLLLNLMSCSHELAFIDPLTGIPGRRAMETELKHLGRTYTLAMLDVDHFKQFNDKYGHKTGDDVLRLVAQFLLNINIKAEVYRYGGEEFTILFKGRRKGQCIEALEELREAIANYPMHIRDVESRPLDDLEGKRKRGSRRKNETVQITVSIGVADSQEDSRTANVLKVADKALYKAKQQGRNQVA
ncbi:GGDEF domain-containing protein [Photobacterium sp. 1_MG-2023]|uniref:GGDEF domain-containing protein n=1 Tax=Photobacterium sp. 1_MG-2023 TaxID=3062646 RepID=UPI0026E167A0|nr:GGDEF domain-containing protein [Photobacterium sp. 1_MG-2023]MDO6705976.1 GGDEF domain-containing protein [Photobacterium sp. 1_MG-2023]